MTSEVQITPLVSSEERVHVMDSTCWCGPRIIARWWNGQDVVVHRPMSSPSRRLCAHADRGGEGAHWLEPGERCPLLNDGYTPEKPDPTQVSK